jgi:hypothetical protein
LHKSDLNSLITNGHHFEWSQIEQGLKALEQLTIEEG